MKRLLLLSALVLGVFLPVRAQVSPMQGIGAIQFLDNNGKPLSAGVLYSFQAGTTTQQATFTDSTGTVQNPNPMPFSASGRAYVWLQNGAFYKFVGCAQNDGAACASGDILFTVDQVPGSPSGGSSGGSPFTGTFITGSANPSTTGILRLASADTVCWRNAANTTNLCLSKDNNDILNWSGGSYQMPEVGTPVCSVNKGVIWPASAAHRWWMCSNATTAQQVVGAGVDINTSDQVTQLHFGATALPFSGTAPSNYQYLLWNGSNLVGGSSNVWAGTSGGSANAQTLTLSPALTSYVTGQRFTFTAGLTNTGATTLNINGVGATTVNANASTGLVALAGGEILTGNAYTVTYNGSVFVLDGTKPTYTFKQGSNGGDYTTASTTYTNVDGTNLTYAVTIPVGWKLDISATGAFSFSGGGSTGNIALFDGAGQLQGQFLGVTAGGAPMTAPFALNWMITGDGASHTITLQYHSNGGSFANIVIKNSSSIFPTMTFRLTPST